MQLFCDSSLIHLTNKYGELRIKVKVMGWGGGGGGGVGLEPLKHEYTQAEGIEYVVQYCPMSGVCH